MPGGHLAALLAALATTSGHSRIWRPWRSAGGNFPGQVAKAGCQLALAAFPCQGLNGQSSQSVQPVFLPGSQQSRPWQPCSWLHWRPSRPPGGLVGRLDGHLAATGSFGGLGGLGGLTGGLGGHLAAIPVALAASGSHGWRPWRPSGGHADLGRGGEGGGVLGMGGGGG